MPEQTLAQRVRAKYPGEYDDLSDHDLETKVLAKYPEYKDIPLTPATPSASALDLGVEAVTRAAKGVVKPPIDLLHHLYTDMSGEFDQAKAAARAGDVPTMLGHAIAGSPVGQVAKIGRDIVGAQWGQLTKAKEQYDKGDYEKAAAYTVAAGLPVLGPMATATGEEVRAGREAGDVRRQVGAVAELGGMLAGPKVLSKTVPPVVRAGGKVALAPVKVVQRVAAGAQEGGVGGAVAGVIRTTAPESPVSMAVRGIKPRNTRLTFAKEMKTAMDLRLDRYLGKPIESLDDLRAGLAAGKKDVWDQYTALGGPQRAMKATIDGDKIATAVRQSVPLHTRRTNPAAGEAVDNIADTYRGRLNLQDAEELLRGVNAQLEAYYNKFPAARRAAQTANPETAHLLAEAEQLRKGINEVLDAPGGGAAARELKRRYGALKEVEDAVHRRSNVAARQQPESLSEQFSKWQAASDLARGVFKIGGGIATMRGGPIVHGAADIAGAWASRKVATFLKDQQTTDALIRRAFAAHKGELPPVGLPPATPIRGLLPPGVPRLPPANFPEGPMAVRGEYGARWTPEMEPPPAPPAAPTPSVTPPRPLAPTPPPSAVETPRSAEDIARGMQERTAAAVAEIETKKTALRTRAARPPKAPVKSNAPAPVVTKPVAATAPIAEPEQAAAVVTKQVERLIDVSGAKSAGDVRQRVIDGLSKELAGAQADAGFASVQSVPQKGGGMVVRLDDTPVASIDKYGDITKVWSDELQGFTDTKGRTTYEGPQALKDLIGKRAMTGFRGEKWADMTPTERIRESGLVVAAAFARAKGAGQVVMRVPGDGVFTVERNPHAIQMLLDRIKKSSPSIWKGLTEKK